VRPAWAASAERRMDAEAIRDDIGLSCFALSYGLRYVRISTLKNPPKETLSMRGMAQDSNSLNSKTR